MLENKQGEVFFDQKVWSSLSEEGKDLAMQMLDKDQYKRPGAKECLQHKWFSKDLKLDHPLPNPDIKEIGTMKIKKHNSERIDLVQPHILKPSPRGSSHALIGDLQFNNKVFELYD
jgi:serine/threonine protein kinase